MKRLLSLIFLGTFVAFAMAQPRDKVCKKDSGLFPHEQYCDYYYDCLDGVATLQLCPNGLAFSGKGRGLLSSCDYPHRVGCPDEEGRTMGQSPISTDNCHWQYGVFAHQTSCTRYWQCWNGTATAQQCPFSLLYNDDLHSCDWPDNVPDCQKHPLCKDSPNGKIAIDNACVRFWLCVGGYPRLQRCAAGLAFSPVNLRCELANLVPGCEPPPTTQSPDDDRNDDRPERPVRGRVEPRPVPASTNQDLGDDDQDQAQARPRRPNSRPQFRPQPTQG